MTDDLLGFKLLKAANLNSQHEQLIKATITAINYENIKKKIKSIFSFENKIAATEQQLKANLHFIRKKTHLKRMASLKTMTLKTARNHLKHTIPSETSIKNIDQKQDPNKNNLGINNKTTPDLHPQIGEVTLPQRLNTVKNP